MGGGGDEAVEEAVAGTGGLVLRGAAAGGQVGWVEDGGVRVVLVHCCGMDLSFVLCCWMVRVILFSDAGGMRLQVDDERVVTPLCGGARGKVRLRKKRKEYWRLIVTPSLLTYLRHVF